MGRITLLTDFGTADGYVAAMRGVIASRAPAIIVDDVSHEIAAGDVRAGAHALATYWQRYPAGTVHVAVIDPGVGTSRRSIVIAAAGRCGVGPDNGVLTPMLEVADDVREITASGLILEPLSTTFHGRDVFAPAAAYLAAGGLTDKVGPPVSEPRRLDMPEPGRSGADVTGRVVHVDRFGTLVTNLPAPWIPAGAEVRIAGISAGVVRRTYGDVAPGELVAVIGSGGMLEVSVRDGSAARTLGVGRDAAVLVTAAADG